MKKEIERILPCCKEKLKEFSEIINEILDEGLECYPRYKFLEIKQRLEEE